MKNMLVLPILLVSSFLLSSSENETTRVICDTFQIITEVEGNILAYNVITDLPDNADLDLAIFRNANIWENGKRKKDVLIDICKDNRCTVGKLKETQEIDIADLVFQDELYTMFPELKEKNKKVGIEQISSSITVKASILVKQSNPDFGKNLANLQGNAVKTVLNWNGESVAEKINFIKNEVRIECPFGEKLESLIDASLSPLFIPHNDSIGYLE